MAHTCSECTYLNLDKEYCSNDGRFWCDTKLEWHYADEAECWRYCKAYGRSDSVVKSYLEYSKKCQSNSSGCYLTTIACEILGMSDNNIYLYTLRKFRKEKLQKDDKYKEILVEYDIVGPIIANKLKKEINKDMIAKNLLRMGIAKTVYHIMNDEDLEAIKTYTTMTKLLIEAYNIKIKPTEEQIKNSNINLSGHGKYVKQYK